MNQAVLTRVAREQISSRLRSQFDAEDLMQSVAGDAIAASQWPLPGPVLAHRIRLKAIDKRRRVPLASASGVDTDEPGGNCIEQARIDVERSIEHGRLATERLDPTKQRILRMIREGTSQSDVGRELGLSRREVQLRLYAAWSELRLAFSTIT